MQLVGFLILKAEIHLLAIHIHGVREENRRPAEAYRESLLVSHNQTLIWNFLAPHLDGERCDTIPSDLELSQLGILKVYV